MATVTTLGTVRRAVATYGRREWPRLIASILLLLGAAGATVLQPWPLKVVVDVVLEGDAAPEWVRSLLTVVPPGIFAGDERYAGLLLMCLAILLVQALVGGLRVLGDYVLAGAGQRMVGRVRCDLFDAVQGQSLRFHQERSPGDTLYRVLTDTQSFQDLFVFGLAPALTAALTLAGIASVVLSRDPALTLAILLVALPLVALVGGLDRWVSRGSTRCHERESAVSDHVQESLQGIQVLQAFGREKEGSARFRRHAATSVTAHLRLQALESGSQAVIDLALAAGMAVVVWMAGSRALAGRMTPGDLVLLISYLWMLYEPVASLAYVGASVQEAAAGTRRVFEILDAPSAVADLPQARDLPGVVRGRVSFRSVRHAYGSEHPVLRDFNLEVAPGTSVAVLGASGAGKTTLAHLLLRFVEPAGGAIYVDGIDVRACRLASLRASVAYVPQEPMLFQGTIRENIAIGCPSALDREIERAARAAGIHAHVAGLAAGYGTRIGSRGATLSQGQKQRIALARAFLRDAPILVMDEPTSSLDVETEAGILAALQHLMRGRTVLLISHRIATAAIADRVVVLRDGAVAEEGPPLELLGRASHFRRMHRLALAAPPRVLHSSEGAEVRLSPAWILDGEPDNG